MVHSLLKKVLRLNDGEIAEMRDQIKSEITKDPMDGGIDTDGGDGIQRIPTDPSGMPTDPDMNPKDRTALAYGMEPNQIPDSDAEKEPTEDEFDKSLTVKGKKK